MNIRYVYMQQWHNICWKLILTYLGLSWTCSGQANQIHNSSTPGISSVPPRGIIGVSMMFASPLLFRIDHRIISCSIFTKFLNLINIFYSPSLVLHKSFNPSHSHCGWGGRQPGFSFIKVSSHCGKLYSTRQQAWGTAAPGWFTWKRLKI